MCAHVRPQVPTEAQFILKWGGELTSLGEAQSALLGTRFRNSLYPGELGMHPMTPHAPPMTPHAPPMHPP